MKPINYTLEDFEAVFGPKALMTHSEYCYFHDTANTAINLIEDIETEQLQSLFLNQGHCTMVILCHLVQFND